MKFGFIGGTYRGYVLFKFLIERNFCPEFCLILKEDEHEHVKFSTQILELAQANNISASIKKRLFASDNEDIKRRNLDFVIVCGWRTMVDPELNYHIKYGLIAAHDSLLPKYRGFAPLNWAIINGEVETGVTLFKINDGDVDTGEIVSQKKIAIGFEETINEISQSIIKATCELYYEMIKHFIVNHSIPSYPQIDSGASYTCKRTPEDGRIIWERDSIAIYNLIRALIYPYSGAFFFHQNRKFEVRSALIGPQNSKNYIGRIPGRIISISDMGVEVLCGSGTILVKEIFDAESQSVKFASDVFKSITIRLN